MKDKEIFIGIDVFKETLDISIAGKHYKIPDNKNLYQAYMRII